MNWNFKKNMIYLWARIPRSNVLNRPVSYHCGRIVSVQSDPVKGVSLIGCYSLFSCVSSRNYDLMRKTSDNYGKDII